jgi:hypothetical protein
MLPIHPNEVVLDLEIASKKAIEPKLLVKPMHTLSPSYSNLVAHSMGISDPKGNTPEQALAPRKGVHFLALILPRRRSQSLSDMLSIADLLEFILYGIFNVSTLSSS